MRLVCPNCSAQYEIDGSMIPEEGRDVQCSNCGHTWFELPVPTAAPELAAEEEVEDEFDVPPAYDLNADDSFEDDDGELVPSRRPTSVPDFISRADFESDSDGGSSDWDDSASEDIEEGATEAETREIIQTVTSPADAETRADEAADDPAEAGTEGEVIEADLDFEAEAEPEESSDGVDPSAEVTPEEEIAPAAAAVATPRRPADAAALDILREEAERELSQRRAPPSDAIETQADLGIESIRSRRTPSRALRARMAQMGHDVDEGTQKKGSWDDTPPAKPAPESEATYEAPRRDLLPDIDEINSTLKTSAKAAADPDVVKRSGFRVGFLLMVFLTVAAIFAYAQAPAIARALPQTESTMISYVDWANGLRDRLNGLIGN